MCLTPSSFSEASYVRTLASVVRLVLSFVLDTREMEALLTLTSLLNSNRDVLSLVGISQMCCATALLYSKDDFIIHEHSCDASPQTTACLVDLNYGEQLIGMIESCNSESAARVSAESSSFVVTDFWAARHILQAIIAMWTSPANGTNLDNLPSLCSSETLLGRAYITYHVFQRLLALQIGTSVAEWVCVGLANILRKPYWREACICLFSAACSDLRGRSLLFLSLIKELPKSPMNSNDNQMAINHPGISLDEVFLISGLMFFNSGHIQPSSAHVFVSVCSNSGLHLCEALAAGCLSCHESTITIDS